MLTKKQHELLLFVHGHLQKHGVSPSYDEMKAALGLKSKSGIHRLITGLEERGFIRRLAHRARAIDVLRLPDDMAPAPTNVRHLSIATAGTPKPFTNPFDPRPANNDSESVALPLFGRIAAGTPIEALRDHNTFVDVPTTLLGSGDHYALEVEGDSMVEAGILDGDTVVVERSDSADNGAVVVALIDEEEVTLKRLRRKGGAIALEPANKRYETRIFPPERVRIQGKLVGLIRQY